VGLVYYRRAEYPAAINRIEPVTEKAHDTTRKAHANYILARCYQKQGQFEKARHYFTESVLAAPDSKWAKKSKKRLNKLPQQPDASAS
jgi:outer membrane protein assembly factor BamD (BamD/ComL family)